MNSIVIDDIYLTNDYKPIPNVLILNLIADMIYLPKSKMREQFDWKVSHWSNEYLFDNNNNALIDKDKLYEIIIENID